ncbi:MAG: hypothetical protein ABIA12_02975 [Candidatus Aenigmatarchaeota archaeon]
MVLVLVAGVMVAEGVYLSNLVKNLEVIKRSAREMVVVSAVNTIEFRKRALQNAVAYSFQSAAGEVMAMGGFCEHDASAYEDACKAPGTVPTLGCVPWWKVYNDVYAPDEEGGPRSFVGYLKNRTAAVYDDYAQSISKGSLQYYPSDTAFVVERAGSYKVRVNTTSSLASLQNRKDINVGEKTDMVVITESNTAFTSAFESPELELFSFARSRFASGNDVIKLAFTTAAVNMPERCKEASVGDVCENNARGCETRLSSSCTSASDGSVCDANGDGKLVADERYKCAVEAILAEPVSSGDGRLDAEVSIGCVEAGHSSSVSGTVTRDCSKVLSKGCGCAQVCTPAMCGCASEGSECGDCRACGDSANGAWIADSSCGGSNTFDCSSFGVDSCPSPCCGLVEAGKSASGDPIYSCNKVRCSDASFDSCPTTCGCAKRTSWNFECSGLSAGCGLSNGCCIRPYGVLENAVCNYDYFGSANASVVVRDTKSAYPTGSSWEQAGLRFYVASGNAGCGGVNAVENPAEPGKACCAVTATNSADKSSGCKTE